MHPKITRRSVLKSSAAAAVAAASPLPAASLTFWKQSTVKPLVISSENGFVDRNGGTEPGVGRAYRLMTGGSDVLDALIECVNLPELDPTDASVGYGGLPNADGVVQLDSCCMHGPKKWAGGVAGIEGVRTPSKVAQLVMDQ